MKRIFSIFLATSCFFFASCGINGNLTDTTTSNKDSSSTVTDVPPVDSVSSETTSAALPREVKGEAFDWEALKKSYYTATSPFLSNGKPMEQSEIAKADKMVDYSAAVNQFMLKYNIFDQKSEFIRAFRSGDSLWSMAEDTKQYIVAYEDELGLGSALVDKDGEIMQSFPGDGGKICKLPLTETLKKSITKSTLNPSAINAHSLYILDVCGGILFTDGEYEYYYVLVSWVEDIKEDRLYSAKDLVDTIENDETITVREPTQTDDEMILE